MLTSPTPESWAAVPTQALSPAARPAAARTAIATNRRPIYHQLREVSRTSRWSNRLFALRTADLLGCISRFWIGQGSLSSTAAPLTRSWAKSASARLASSRAYGVVETCTPTRAANSRKSSPSRRVLAVTLHSARSSKR